MAAGIALARWFKHETLRVYAMLEETDAERDERRLVEWIGRKGGSVTPRQVQQGCRWLKEPGAAEAALENLVKKGRGSWQEVPTTAQGGRPARIFVLSTASTVYEIPAKSNQHEGFVDVDGVDNVESQASTGMGLAGLFGKGIAADPYREGN